MSAHSLQKISQIGVPVVNLNRAVFFYKETLGLPLLFQTDRMAFFDLNGLRIMLSPPEKEEFAHPSSVLYFQVEDIRGAYEELSSKDVIFTGTPHIVTKMDNIETWMAFFHDSEGNTMALVSEVEI
ncbi:VOC family protein [Pradoshia sp.]